MLKPYSEFVLNKEHNTIRINSIEQFQLYNMDMIKKLNLLNVEKTLKKTFVPNIVNTRIQKQALTVYFPFYIYLTVKQVLGADFLTIICFLDSCGKPIKKCPAPEKSGQLLLEL